ncbi:MAG: hypothetical protein LBL74_05130 [Bacteroidales bacterium]|jgi:hypothetical protein|nr:hypothetical protein [Bacteroidales bacterium]
MKRRFDLILPQSVAYTANNIGLLPDFIQIELDLIRIQLDFIHAELDFGRTKAGFAGMKAEINKIN